jgi:hypothetical protein
LLLLIISYIYLFFTVTKESQPQQGMLAQPPQGTLALGEELQKQQSNDNGSPMTMQRYTIALPEIPQRQTATSTHLSIQMQ